LFSVNLCPPPMRCRWSLLASRSLGPYPGCFVLGGRPPSCGGDEHILVSESAAELLRHLTAWPGKLRYMGEYLAKSDWVQVWNFQDGVIGNPGDTKTSSAASIKLFQHTSNADDVSTDRRSAPDPSRGSRKPRSLTPGTTPQRSLLPIRRP
jgi:hypothetical protein